MPDRRRHRGPHPEDARLFAAESIPALRAAVADVAWLLGRGYPETAVIELVGNRYSLTSRQRVAVWRSSSSDEAVARRVSRKRCLEDLRGRALRIDGYNVLITLESALSGGVLLVGRDGCIRDLARLHGTYRRVEETDRALTLVGELLTEHEPRRVTWLFDRPVSNSGRLAQRVRELAAASGWPWEAKAVPDPDRELIATSDRIATSDGQILDACEAWVDLVGPLVTERIPDAWLVSLGA